MSKAEMQCRECGNDWDYSGLSSQTAFCPKCGTMNYLDDYRNNVTATFGPAY